MRPRVFISYRRRDSRDAAARLADRLATANAAKWVFLDVSEIEPGETFPQRLEKALGECDVVLALIGREWVSPTVGGGSHIAADDDFVRLEIARAIALGKRLIPVLLDSAEIPPAASLPDDIRVITQRNALFLRHTSFNQDYQVLLDAIAGRKPRGPLRRLADRAPKLMAILKIVLGTGFGLVALLLIALVNHRMTGGLPLETTLGGRDVLIMLVLATIGLGVGVAFRIGR